MGAPGVTTSSPRRRELVLRACAVAVTVGSAALLAAGLVGPTAVAPPVAGPTAGLDLPATVLADVAAYRAPRRAAVVVATVLGVVVPLLVARIIAGRGGGGGRWAGAAAARLRRFAPPATVAVVAGGTVLLTAVARLPLGVWAGVVQDGRWGFRTATVGRWFADRVLLIGGEVLLVALGAAAVTLLVRRRPDGWVPRLVLGVALTGPLLLALHPIVVHGLLLPTGPLPPGAHRDAIAEVVARSDVDVPVLVGRASLRTTRPNAVATGLGPTARIVVYDTLLELPPSRAAAVVAHELAHVERRDPLRAALAPVPFVAVGGLLVRRLLGASTGGADGPRPRGPSLPPVRRLALVAVLVLAVEAAATPVVAGLTRANELRTDVRAVELTGDAAAHVALLHDLVSERLTDPAPPRWYELLVVTHPPPSVRARAVSGAAHVSATR
mgnify:CR=1 FL=1